MILKSYSFFFFACQDILNEFQKRCYVPADYMHTECISLFSQKGGFFLLIDVNYKYDYL